MRTHSAMALTVSRLLKKTERMRVALQHSTADTGDLDARYHALRTDLLALDAALNGTRAQREPGEKTPAVISNRLFAVERTVGGSTYGPTATSRRSLELANAEIARLGGELNGVRQRVTELGRALLAAGAPWIEGEPLPGGR